MNPEEKEMLFCVMSDMMEIIARMSYHFGIIDSYKMNKIYRNSQRLRGIASEQKEGDY